MSRSTHKLVYKQDVHLNSISNSSSKK